MKSVYQFTNIGIIVNGFSAYHISSRGLKYALAFSSFEDEEVKEEEYNKALLNVLTAQDFDSIPLVEHYEGPITAIGRRRLHDGDLDDVFTLSTEEVFKLPQTASVIRCIFEVLSNEHHIVFLTDEEDQIQDVVTIGMLSSPIIQEYLTLLVSKLSSENWDFNEKYLKSSFTPTYDFPKFIHEELKKLGKLVDDSDGATPTDFDVSKQIVHILGLLQPLKHWEGGQKSDSLLSADFPLIIATPDYTPGTAGYFAQHPFGAVKEDGSEDLAFRLFTEANNWDRLLLLSENGKKYTHIIEQGEEDVELDKLEIVDFVDENQHMDELVHLFNETQRPICVKFLNSKYRGIIMPQDLIFSDYTKSKMMDSFVKVERALRNTLLHYLSSIESNTDSKYWLKTGGRGAVWKAGKNDICDSLWNYLPSTLKQRIGISDIKEMLELRNDLAHSDFSIQTSDEIEAWKIDSYLQHLQISQPELEHLLSELEKIHLSIDYSQAALFFHNEYLSILNLNQSKSMRKKLHQRLQEDLTDIKYQDERFCFTVRSRSVDAANKIKSLSHTKLKTTKIDVIDLNDTIKKIVKKKIDASLCFGKNKFIKISEPVFKRKIIEVFKEVRLEYKFNSNAKILESTLGLSPKGIKGATGNVLDWCGYSHSISSTEQETSEDTVRFRKIEFSNDEEE